MKRVAAAVGDGSTAIRLIHDYLALAPPYAKVNESRLLAGERFASGWSRRMRDSNSRGVAPNTLSKRAP
jgi:hypothetical protein